MMLHVALQAYMWCAGPDVPKTLPLLLAVPWATVGAALQMPPVLVYATYNLMNWRRLDVNQPIALGNLAVQHVRRVGKSGLDCGCDRSSCLASRMFSLAHRAQQQCKHSFRRRASRTLARDCE